MSEGAVHRLAGLDERRDAPLDREEVEAGLAVVGLFLVGGH